MPYPSTRPRVERSRKIPHRRLLAGSWNEKSGFSAASIVIQWLKAQAASPYNKETTIMRKALVLGSFLTLLAGQALAQANNAIAVNGVLQSFDAASISVKADDGGAVQTFTLAPKLLLLQIKAASLADIKSNDFVASAAVRGPDGKLHSTELRIFPDALRGVGEGQRPMNDARNQTMTNATVTGAAIVNGSNNIKVKFDGGESELILDPGVPVTAIVPVEREQVKPGAKVRVQGTKTGDEAVINRITVQ